MRAEALQSFPPQARNPRVHNRLTPGRHPVRPWQLGKTSNFLSGAQPSLRRVGHVASRRLCSDGKSRGDDSMAFYELRQYFVRPGKMDEWVKIMEEEIIPFQVSKGMVICGSFRGETDDSKYVWMRRFDS